MAALAAAIPVIGEIVKTIFGNKDKDKKTKKEADAAVAPEKNASSAALKSISDELSLIGILLEYCLPAEDGIVIIKAVLEANKTGDLSSADKRVIKRSWKLVGTNLSKAREKDIVKTVNGITDEFTKNTFLDVINADTDSIGQDIEGSGEWALGPLKDDVNQLHDLLKKINKVGGRVVGGIAVELGKLAVAQKK